MPLENNMDAMPIFLTATWRHLVMINYEIDPAVLQPYVPIGTELDTWQGKTFVSLVGFMFLNTRIWGYKIPFHSDFEEVNLRFYVKRRHPDGDRRGVVFIKEIVPKVAIAILARWLYNENYVRHPMSHSIIAGNNEISATYSWEAKGKSQTLGLHCVGSPKLAPAGSLAEFIADHYWGYVAQRGKSTMEYEVKHPSWRLWEGNNADIDIDMQALYGANFASFLERPPTAVFLAEGSEISVSQGTLID